MQEREFTAWNEAMALRYDIERYYREAHPIVRWIERQRLDLIRAFAQTRRTDVVLEAGCGAGHVLEYFDCCTRIGLDISSTMLHRARRRLGDAAMLVLGTVERLPFRDASIDVAVCTVLEHTLNPQRALSELVRVVAPGGRLVISIPNERRIDDAKRIIRRLPLARTMLRTLAAEANEWHLHRFDAARLREIAAGVGAIERIRPVPSVLFPVGFVALIRPANGRDLNQSRPGEMHPQDSSRGAS